MSEPFIGQIEIKSFSFPPSMWSNCDGQVIQVSQNNALFALLGNNFGGNGRSTFAFPDLRGRAPVGIGTGTYATGSMSYPMGTIRGMERVTLSTAEIAAHTHPFNATNDTTDAAVNATGGRQLGAGDTDMYAAPGTLTAMAVDAVSSEGGGQSHDNMQPYLGVLFCIALQGLFPPRS